MVKSYLKNQSVQDPIKPLLKVLVLQVICHTTYIAETGVLGPGILQNG